MQLSNDIKRSDIVLFSFFFFLLSHDGPSPAPERLRQRFCTMQTAEKQQEKWCQKKSESCRPMATKRKSSVRGLNCVLSCRRNSSSLPVCSIKQSNSNKKKKQKPCSLAKYIHNWLFFFFVLFCFCFFLILHPLGAAELSRRWQIEECANPQGGLEATWSPAFSAVFKVV